MSREQLLCRAAPDAVELFSLLTENTNDFIRLLDQDGRTVYASPSVERLYGRALDPCCLNSPTRRTSSLAGSGGSTSWPGERIGSVSCARRQRELAVVGDVVEALVQYHNRPHVLTVCRDVTERTEAEDDLRRSERLLAEAERIAHVGFWENDLDADRITWSDEACRMVGFPPGPRTLAEFRERIHPDDRPVQGRGHRSGAAR